MKTNKLKFDKINMYARLGQYLCFPKRSVKIVYRVLSAEKLFDVKITLMGFESKTVVCNARS